MNNELVVVIVIEEQKRSYSMSTVNDQMYGEKESRAEALPAIFPSTAAVRHAHKHRWDNNSSSLL